MAYADEVLADDPQFYWRLDETSGLTSANSAGNGPFTLPPWTFEEEIEWGPYPEDLPDLTAPSLIPGDSQGTAVRFDPGTYAYGQGQIGYLLNDATEFTLETWVKVEGEIMQGSFLVFNDYFTLEVDYFNDKFILGARRGSTRLRSNVELGRGTAYHLALTMETDPVTDLRTLKLFVNGQLEDEKTATISFAPVFSSTDSKNYISLGNNGWTNALNYMTLTLDELAVYQTALSAERIAEHFIEAVDPASPVYQSESEEPGWKVYLHDWAGARIGELTDAQNIQINTGLNKNSSMTFETTLRSPLGKQLANRDYSLISAWRRNPYEATTELKFSGMVMTTEENGDDDTPTIAVSAVGPYWRLSRRVADDAQGSGRRQTGLAPAPSSLMLLVADFDNGRIQRYNAKTGVPLGSFSIDGSPVDVAVGPDNSIYVLDNANDRVRKYSYTGTLIKSWGTTGSGNNNLDDPRGIVVDNDGNIWVSDRGNARVVKYNSEGSYLLKAVMPSSHNAELMRLSVDTDGFIRVADNKSSGTKGWYRISPTGRIVPANSSTRHTQVLKDNTGAFYFVQSSGNVFRRGRNQKKASRIFSHASNTANYLTVGDDRAIYVTVINDANSVSQILRYDAAGNLSRVIGTYGTGGTQIKNPRGTALLRPATRDAIEISAELINQTNQLEGSSWVKPAEAQGSSKQIFVNPGTWGGYRRINEVIEELSASFEWLITPRFESDSNGLILGEWYANSTIGENKANLVTFEYGTGRHNADSYSIKRSLEGLATKASYPAADVKPYSVTATANNAGEIGIFEEIITGSLLDRRLRTNLLNYALRFRKQPRLLVEITPARSDQTDSSNLRVPIPLIDYNVGDIVGLEIVEDGEQRISTAEARIYDISIQVDENGQETATINLYLDN